MISPADKHTKNNIIFIIYIFLILYFLTVILYSVFIIFHCFVDEILTGDRLFEDILGVYFTVQNTREINTYPGGYVIGGGSK